MDFPSFNSNTVGYILQTFTVRSILTRTENTQAKGLKVSENISSKFKGSVDSHLSMRAMYIADSLKVALGIRNRNNASI